MGNSSQAERAGILVAFVAAVATSALGQAARPAADRDTLEVQSFRLSMPVIQKMDAVYKAMAAEEAKDPRRQQLARKKAELKALESKQAPTEAEQERMSALADEIARLQETDASVTTADAPETLAEMARRVDAVPALAAAVRGAGMTSREFATVQLALLQTGLAHALLKASPAGTPPPPGVLKENLEFFRLHEKELQQLLASWDKDSAER